MPLRTDHPPLTYSRPAPIRLRLQQVTAGPGAGGDLFDEEREARVQTPPIMSMET